MDERFSFDEKALIKFLRNPEEEFVLYDGRVLKVCTSYCCENYITYLFAYIKDSDKDDPFAEKEEYYVNLHGWNARNPYIELIDAEAEEILAFFFPRENGIEIKEPCTD